MNLHDATEVAFRNGYNKGRREAILEIRTRVYQTFGSRSLGDGLIRNIFAKLTDELLEEPNDKEDS
jgi:hypothetical protein